jgi:PilZ domain
LKNRIIRVADKTGKDATMEEPSIQERRKSKRRSLTYYMLVMDSNSREMLGHLVDITPLGLMMDSQKPLPLETDYRLRLDTMPDVADKDYIKFTARTKWCLPDAVEPYLFDIGFSIIDIAQHDAEIIRQIAEKYAARDSFSFPAS